MSEPATPPPVFRDTTRAEASGLIIASDVMCPICSKPCPAEEPPHRKCLDARVIETFERTMASNTQVIESNRQVAQIFGELNATLQKFTPPSMVSSRPPQGTVHVDITGPANAEPATKDFTVTIPAVKTEGGGVLWPFPTAQVKTAAETVPKRSMTVKERRAEALRQRRLKH